MAQPKRIVTPTGVVSWEIRFRDHRTGEQRRRRYATRELAERALAQAILANQADPRTPANRELTVAELLVEEGTHSKRNPKTRASYVRCHVPTWLLEMTARHVAIEHIDAVLAEAAKRLSRPSVKKLRGFLYTAFQYGVQRRICDRNPADGALIPKQCHPSRRARKIVDAEVDPDEIPSPAEARAIAAAIQPRFRVMVHVLWILGLRLGEAMALNVADWNPETRLLRVWRSGAHTEATKGHREFRDVDVPPYLAEAIDGHISEFCSDDGPLFPGPRGGRLTGAFRRRYFYPAVDKALGQQAKDSQHRRRIRPHDLRHTAATVMIYAGITDVEIANQLGHSNPAFTRRVYAGVWRRQEREVSRKLNDSLGEL